MVDRITPVPTREEIARFSETTGVADKATVFCEAFRQWVIEDEFACGRPDWSRVGAQFVRDVAPYEAMKLRLLNASHLAIAGLGALSGYETVEQTMNDPAIRHYMARLMDEETGPLLAPVPGVNLAQYKATLIARFQNPAIRDTVARINTDAHINLLLDPLRDALAKGAPIDLLSLALAAWCRRTSDALAAGIRIGGANANPDLEKLVSRAPDPLALLSIESLFGDLGRNLRLTESVRAWLDRFHRGGVPATLSRAFGKNGA
jgi:mannitol 2-dehydrogenase